MSMIIDQEYMDEYVVEPLKKMQKKIDDLEEKISLAESNSAHLVKQFDKVIKAMKEKKK